MGSTPFWINGKPGSGKSTLMKYLGESDSTLKRLPCEGQGWAVVRFFFDYHSGKSTANDTLGMLKLFLRQLSMKIPDIAKRLEDQTTLRDELARDRVETHMDVIADLLAGSDVKVCAFIDGLDEYDDDLWSLCSTLESLRSRTGIKMCLASRPEPAFEAVYSELASITMQDHNRSSIKIYTQNKVAKFFTSPPFVQELFPEELLDLVVEKAQAVILWARPVLEEMIKSCEEDTTSTDLYVFLEALPAELGTLYERILGKSNKKYQGQAALVLHLLNEADGSLPALVLYQAWN